MILRSQPYYLIDLYIKVLESNNLSVCAAPIEFGKLLVMIRLVAEDGHGPVELLHENDPD